MHEVAIRASGPATSCVREHSVPICRRRSEVAVPQLEPTLPLSCRIPYPLAGTRAVVEHFVPAALHVLRKAPSV